MPVGRYLLLRERQTKYVIVRMVLLLFLVFMVPVLLIDACYMVMSMYIQLPYY